MQMRAARVVGLGEVRCESTVLPEPAPGQALVRTLVAGVCGADAQQVFRPAVPLPYPLPYGYPGHQGVARVVWSAEPTLREGQRVLTLPTAPQARGFADYQMLDADHCLPLPEEHGAPEDWLLAPALGSALFALGRVPKPEPEATCAVLGLGSAGALFCALLKRAGVTRVIASDPSPQRAQAAARFGCLAGVPPEHLLDAVLDETAGHGADLVIDASGSTAALQQMPSLARRDAHLLCYSSPESAAPVPLDYAALLHKRLTLQGAFGAECEPGLGSFQLAIELLRTRSIDPDHWPSQQFSLESVAEALEAALDASRPALQVHLRVE